MSDLRLSEKMYAQTKIQLLEQLRDGGYTEADLVLVLRAYAVAAELVSCRFQGNNNSFIAHLVGVASIAAAHGAGAEIVAVALLHSAYRNGDFGEGPLEWLCDVAAFLLGRWSHTQRRFLYNKLLSWYRGWRPFTRLRLVSPAKRRRLQRQFGARIEATVYRFTALRWWPETLPALVAGSGALDSVDRAVVFLYLANELERTHDGGLLYHAHSEQKLAFVRDCGDSVVKLAEEISGPRLATELRQAYAWIMTASVPQELRLSPRWEAWSYLRPPLSARWRMGARLRKVLMHCVPGTPLA